MDVVWILGLHGVTRASLSVTVTDLEKRKQGTLSIGGRFETLGGVSTIAIR